MNPAYVWLAIAAAALLGTHLFQRWHRHRHAPAPARPRVPAPPPVPGPANADAPPARPAPAPGSAHGGIAYSIRSWNCGRIRVWDGHGKLAYAHACGCLTDAAIEKFITDTCPGCGRPSGVWCKPGCEYAKDTET